MKKSYSHLNFLALFLLGLIAVIFKPSQGYTTERHSKLKTANSADFLAWNFSKNFQISLDHIEYPEKLGGNTNSDLNQLNLQTSILGKKSSGWRLSLAPFFQFSLNNESTSEKNYIDPQDSYIGYKAEQFSIKLGYNVITWGVTDGYNPLDIVNKKQYFNPLNTKKQAALSLLLSTSLNAFDYDFIYIPKSEFALLPGENSRWLPREIYLPETTNNDLVLNLPNNIRYHYGKTTQIENALENNWALRIQKNFNWFDLSLMSYEGSASLPLIQPQVTGTITAVLPKTVIQVDPDVILNFKNYRLRQGGGSIVFHPGSYLLKWVSSFSQSLGSDPDLPGWSHDNILGLERTFSFSDGAITLVLQNSFLQTEKSNDSNLSISEIFRKALMIGGQWSWREYWSGSFMFLFDEIHHSNYQHYQFEHKINDFWRVQMAADLISGNPQDPLGVYRKNSSLNISTLFYW